MWGARQAVKRLLQVSQARDASLVEFPGAYHELFMGAERDATVEALRDWCATAACLPCFSRKWVWLAGSALEAETLGEAVS